MDKAVLSNNMYSGKQVNVTVGKFEMIIQTIETKE